MTAGNVLIDVHNITVQFRVRKGLDVILSRRPSHITAVDDVSLTIRKGEILGLVGESGSGKTTLGKTILRLVDPVSGEIHVEGRDIAMLPERQLRSIRRKLQTVFQDPLSSLNPRHRVGAALATPLRLHHVVPACDVRQAVDHLLTRVGLSTDFRNRFPHELSGGQLQRIAIARALTMEPDFLVADEAVSKLDVSVRAQILNLLKDIQSATGMTILFITHDLYVARYLCSRIGVMYFGKLVELAATEELFRNPRHPYTKALLATVSNDSARRGGPALASEAFNPVAERRSGCRFYKRCAIRRDHCFLRHPDLETIAPDHRVACYEWEKVPSAP